MHIRNRLWTQLAFPGWSSTEVIFCAKLSVQGILKLPSNPWARWSLSSGDHHDWQVLHYTSPREIWWFYGWPHVLLVVVQHFPLFPCPDCPSTPSEDRCSFSPAGLHSSVSPDSWSEGGGLDSFSALSPPPSVPGSGSHTPSLLPRSIPSEHHFPNKKEKIRKLMQPIKIRCLRMENTNGHP